MAKRFTDTTKYKKHFMRSLPGPYKLLWDFLYHDCDHCGIWIEDFEAAQIYIGRDMVVDKERAIELFNSNTEDNEPRIILLDGGKKWFLPSFITFQYGTQLVTGNRVHLPIINTLTKYNLLSMINIEVVDVGTTVSALRGRITKKVKDDIFLRDQFTCQYCSIQYQYGQLVVDHILPLAKGGNNELKNLCTACVRCNSYKTDFLLDEFASHNHPFLNLTKALKQLLQAPCNSPEGAKDKKQEKEQEQVKEQVTVIPANSDLSVNYQAASGTPEPITLQVKLPARTQAPDAANFEDYEYWTDQVINKNDGQFEQLIMKETFKLNTNILTDLAKSYLKLLAEYPKKAPPDQHRFRVALLGHIRENINKTSNDRATNQGTSTAAGSVIKAGKAFGNLR